MDGDTTSDSRRFSFGVNRQAYLETLSECRIQDAQEDIERWLGGLPFEVASVEGVIAFTRKRDLAQEKTETGLEDGNNIFLFSRPRNEQASRPRRTHQRSGSNSSNTRRVLREIRRLRMSSPVTGSTVRGRNSKCSGAGPSRPRAGPLRHSFRPACAR